MALDLAGGKLFYSEAGSGAVMRANLDGSGKEIVAPGGNGSTLTGMCFAYCPTRTRPPWDPRQSR